MPTTQQLIARRIGRITFAGVLLAGVAYLAVAASSIAIRRPWHEPPPRFDAAEIISATWLLALLAGAVAQYVVARLPLRRGPEALFVESVMAPVLGIALLLPLTIHMPIALVLGDREGFGRWVGMSLWITGLAHVVFALASALRGYQLAAGRPAWSARRIFLLTVLTSCVPFIVLIGIPPVLVALTALPIVPLLRAMEGIIARERAEIAAAPQLLPRAIAVLPRPTPPSVRG
jgi:hypothetical protein